MAERFDTDVFVAGGGPAGLAAAIAIRQAGLTVTLADAARPPIDKACGEGIMPEGMAALRRLGITPAPGQFFTLAGMRFIDGNGAIDARFPRERQSRTQPGTTRVQASSGIEHDWVSGGGVRRTVLHRWLVERAAEAGVELRWGTRVTGFGKDGVALDGRVVRSRWVIGADGAKSRLRAQAGLDRWRGRQRFGFRRHYGVKPWSEFVEVYWGERGQMYVTPVGADQICVALLTGEQGFGFDEALPNFPGVAKRLSGAKPLARMMGAVTVTRKLPRVWRENLALVGEASGSVDAITGEGLTMAFQQALALAEALRAGDLGLYQAAHDRIGRLPHFMTGLMLRMDRHAAFRQRVFRAFTAEPSLFARLLAVHVGALSPLRFGVRDAASLGWRLLSA
jgi:flavin-dependent dehydrogenase